MTKDHLSVSTTFDREDWVHSVPITPVNVGNYYWVVKPDIENLVLAKDRHRGERTFLNKKGERVKGF